MVYCAEYSRLAFILQGAFGSIVHVLIRLLLFEHNSIKFIFNSRCFPTSVRYNVN